MTDVGARQERKRETCDALKAGKLYLKADYKVHISEDSSVLDYCSVYALSDSTDKQLRRKCGHANSEHCCEC